jgi:hypothetical protein
MLTIQYLPYQQLSALSSHDRVQSILSLLRSGKIILIDGRLSSSDEASLIRETMNNISGEFNGMEIGVMRDNIRKGGISRIKHGIAKWLIGDRSGITFIGPANIISELRQNPENVELHFQKEYLLRHLKPLVQDKSSKNITANIKNSAAKNNTKSKINAKTKFR